VTLRCLDLDGARLEVVEQLHPDLTFGPPKNKRSERTIALDPETVEALLRHRAAQVLARDFAGSAYEDGDLVFANALGHPMRAKSLDDWFKPHRNAATISTGTPNILRHTHATILLTEGVPLHIVAARLGDDLKTVLRTYAHLLPQGDESAAQTMAAQLVPTSG
jgi:integrase